MNEELTHLQTFHGHLGPYVVLGYRMGLIANQHLGDDPFCKSAKVFTEENPPMSCAVDGIQISSGCTLGKANIEIISDRNLKAVFKDESGKQIQIKLKESAQDEIQKNVTKENLEGFAEEIFNRSDNRLFEIII